MFFFFIKIRTISLKKGKICVMDPRLIVMSHDYSELLSNGLQNEPNIFNDI